MPSAVRVIDDIIELAATGFNSGEVPAWDGSVFAGLAIATTYLKLDASNDPVTGAIQFQNASDSTTGFQILDSNGGTPIFNVDTTNERVGIGTNAPAAALHIVAPGTGSMRFVGGTSANVTLIDSDAAEDKKTYQIRSDTDRLSFNLINDGITGFVKRGIILIDDTQQVEINAGAYNSGSALAQLEVNGNLLIKGDTDEVQALFKANATQNANLVEFHSSTALQMAIAGNGRDFVIDTTTGSKIATATAQKLGFWGVTPVVQQVLATGGGASVDNVISLLQTLGICKQS